jgi:2-hydroxychromene-2-carboxylate isomerase
LHVSVFPFLCDPNFEFFATLCGFALGFGFRLGVSKEYGLAKSEALYNVLNRRHFEEGQKLNDAAMLAEAAAEAGVDGAAAAAFMASDAGEAEIKRSQEMLRHMGVHSIPTFIIQVTPTFSPIPNHEALLPTPW